jgi:hypothetical protein
LIIFEIGPCYVPSWPGLWSSYLCIPHIAGMTDSCHHAQPLVEMRSCKLFPQASLEPQSSWSLPHK